MQVGSRVHEGQILYRDVWWAYPPASIYLLLFIFKMFGVKSIAGVVFSQIMAALACLLTYRLSRFLLSPLWAVLATLVVFIDGRNWPGSGFLCYIFSYSGCVSLGGAIGLLFLLFLFFFMRKQKLRWLLACAATTALAWLVKPEYGFAALGTGLLFLFLLLPALGERIQWGMSFTKMVLIYFVTFLAVLLICYAPSVQQAGWTNTWRGISGYRQTAQLLHTIPPWGNAFTWRRLLQGSAMWGLAAIFIIVPLFYKHHAFKPAVRFLTLSGVLTAIAVLLSAFRDPCVILQRIFILDAGVLQSWIKLLWLPMPFVLCMMTVWLIIRWRFIKSDLSCNEYLILSTLLIFYSFILNLRYIFNPVQAFQQQYLATFLPGLLCQVKWNVAYYRLRWNALRLFRVQNLKRWAAACALLLVLFGFLSDLKILAQFSDRLETPRGSIVTTANPRWGALIDFLNRHAAIHENIVILDSHPEYFFLNDRKNPLKQDYFGMLHLDPDDITDIVQRLDSSGTRWVLTGYASPDILEWPVKGDTLATGVIGLESRKWGRAISFLNRNYRIKEPFPIGSQCGYALYEKMY
ncbi:hypothetical protein JW906_00945 [bacterium]|nr:hypothetical protein [bacterium]